MTKTMIINGGTISADDYGKITIKTITGKEINIADAIIAMMKQCGSIRTNNFYDRYKLNAGISIAIFPTDESVKIYKDKDELAEELADRMSEVLAGKYAREKAVFA